jgi:hypothetical protein
MDRYIPEPQLSRTRGRPDRHTSNEAAAGYSWLAAAGSLDATLPGAPGRLGDDVAALRQNRQACTRCVAS